MNVKSPNEATKLIYLYRYCGFYSFIINIPKKDWYYFFTSTFFEIFDGGRGMNKKKDQGEKVVGFKRQENDVG